MKTHKLTIEQLKKLVRAFGYTHDQPEYTSDSKVNIVVGMLRCSYELVNVKIDIYNLTTEQLEQLVDAFGGVHGQPWHTSDPLVNYAVDCLMLRGGGFDEPEYDARLYQDDVEAVEAVFGAPI